MHVRVRVCVCMFQCPRWLAVGARAVGTRARSGREIGGGRRTRGGRGCAPPRGGHPGGLARRVERKGGGGGGWRWRVSTRESRLPRDARANERAPAQPGARRFALYGAAASAGARAHRLIRLGTEIQALPCSRLARPPGQPGARGRRREGGSARAQKPGSARSGDGVAAVAHGACGRPDVVASAPAAPPAVARGGGPPATHPLSSPHLLLCRRCPCK